MSRILAIDPGEKRIGVAISDPTGTIANPLLVIKHVSRLADAARIAEIAHENEVSLIVIGQATDMDGDPTLQGRRSARLAAAIRRCTQLSTVLWDESGSTQEAKSSSIALGVPQKKRRGHLDEIAATIILQSFLDSTIEPKNNI